MFFLDGSHMLRRDGTGIASYARSLALTLKSANAPVALLLDCRVRTGRNLPPIGIDSQVFGNFPPQSRRSRLLEFALQSRLGLTREIRAKLVHTGLLRLESLDIPLPPHDVVYNMSNGMAFAGAVFALRRQLAEVTVPEAVTLAHWTGPSPVRMRNSANVYTLHDAIPLQMPHLVVDRPGEAARRHVAIAAQADHIITVSEQAREDLIETLNLPAERISVTYQPVPTSPPIDREASERLVRDVYATQPGEYAFFCGAIEPKKNLYRLIEAFTFAGTGLKLLMAGPLGWLCEDVTNLIGQLGSTTIVPGRRQVRWLGYLPRLHLAALMRCARFFVFPSLYEGFGLPVAEAMQLGVPVLTSAAGGLGEVAGNAALLVNPLDVSDMARKIRTLAADASLRVELALRGPVQAARFSHTAHLHRLAEAYRKAGVTIASPVETQAEADRVAA